MSDIRNRIVKLLEESKISFMEDIEVQPDLFGGEDTYYKDGKQAISFTDVLECMSEIAPGMDFVDQKEFNDLYWMVFEGNGDFEDIKGKLQNRFGNDIVVKVAQAQYAPEQKKLYVGFVDIADVEDDGIEEAAGLLKKGQRVRIKDTAENFPGEEGVIVAVRSTGISGTPFYTVNLDSGEPYDVVADQVEPTGLDEGWKDTLQSAGKYAKGALAGAAMAGSLATGANASDPMYDGARRPFEDTDMTVQQVQQLSDEEDKATRLPNGMIKDQYGNEWTQEDWDKLMRGEDPFADNDDVHEAVDETNSGSALDEVKNRLSKEFVDLEVTGPTYDKYDADGPKEGKEEYYIEVPEEFYEELYLERMLQEVESKYPEFEYEGKDFSNRLWFAINS